MQMRDSGHFDVAEARQALRKRVKCRQARCQALAAVAETDFERIAKMLIETYRPRRIYRWGSLLHPERFQEISDIDIALEGLEDPMAGLRALDAACRMTRFPVDLVEMERIHPVHAATIRQEGVLVYDRDA